MSHPLTEKLVAAGDFQGVQFIGSERGGREVLRSCAAGLMSAGLELGGKDPAYVRADANLEWTVQELVDGSFGNSGQSCCSVERIYVDRSIHDRFVECFVEATSKLKVGNPLDYPDLGPVVSTAAARRIAGEVASALAMGARRASSIPTGHTLAGIGAYLAPEVLINTSHEMSIMREETFGPVVPIMAVSGDEAALALMNDSRYGLTASVWSRDLDRARWLVDRVEAGTVFVNRCDHADVLLPWGGMKTSGLGRSWGPTTFDELTQVKSFHVREAA
jgi:acyl-CoA reductase-like NAD-dependent aldehyde dehydrogenase